MQFSVAQLSEPLHPHGRPDITVYEIDMGLTRTGWVITNEPASAEDVVAELNREANRRSFGVLCADLMRGVALPTVVKRQRQPVGGAHDRETERRG